MPSRALSNWQTSRRAALDELETAHRSVGGTGPGRRFATEQINQAYAVLLSSQFQGYCRELHSECVDWMIRGVTPAVLHAPLRAEFRFTRKLDKGNPNAGNIGSDFGRLGLEFWSTAERHESRTLARKDQLEQLNLWRNAIAHQDFDIKILGSRTLRLSQVRQWRTACDGLARTFDEVMHRYLLTLTGLPPW
jgi:hypothetical protein